MEEYTPRTEEQKEHGRKQIALIIQALTSQMKVTPRGYPQSTGKNVINDRNAEQEMIKERDSANFYRQMQEEIGPMNVSKKR